MKFPIFVMAFKGYRLRQVIFVAGVMFCLLPPSDTSYDKRVSHGNNVKNNNLQDENFHELHRWKPPVRLIPFDPSRLPRVPLNGVDLSSEAGSGSVPQLPCDDEDGDCGSVTVASGDKIEIETKTRLPQNGLEIVPSNVTTVSAVVKTKYPLASTNMERRQKSTNAATSFPPITSLISLGRKSSPKLISTHLKYDRSEILSNTTSSNASYEHGKAARVATKSPTIRAFRVSSRTRNVISATRGTRNFLYIDKKSTTALPSASPVLENRSTTSVAVKTRPEYSRENMTTQKRELDIDLGGSSNASSQDVVDATSFLNETVLQRSAEPPLSINNTTSLNSSAIEVPHNFGQGFEGSSGGAKRIQNDTKYTRTPESYLLLNYTTVQNTTQKDRSLLGPNLSSPANMTGALSNRSIIQERINHTDLKIEHKLYINMILLKTTPAAELNGSVTVTRRKSFFSQSSSLQFTDAIVHENRVESVIGNMCQGVICRAGGVCREHGANQGECLCPIGRGGKYCEKEQHFTHPKFRGSSYLLFNSSKNVGRNFRLSVEFKADAMNGIIFFVGDPQNTTSDFFTVMLIDGYIQLRTSCGSGFIAITSSKKINSTMWHRVTARKVNGKIYLQVNDELLVSGGRNCHSGDLCFHRIYLGGLQPDTLQERNVGLIPGFAGCMRKFTLDQKEFILRSKESINMNGIDIGDCTAGSCDATRCMNGGECIPDVDRSSQCSCKFGFTSRDCSKGFSVSVPQFNDTGYIQFEGLGSSAWSRIDIEIVFKPQSENGLLFYNGDRIDGRGDFISLSLKNGFVELRFDCGTGEAIIRSRRKVNLGTWHHIIISRKGNTGKMSLDMDEPVVGKSKGAFQMLKLRQPLFIGGINHFSDIPISADVHTSFKGCIEKVIINKRKLLWNHAVGGRDVTNCDSHDCVKNTCSSNGVCESHKGEAWCHCYLGYSGRTCKNGTKISTPRFNGHSFLKFGNKELFRHLSLPTSVLSLEFKSAHGDGLILWNGQKHINLRWKGDFLSLALINGYLVCRYNLGSGDVILNSTKKLNDNKWHHVRLYRNIEQGIMQIDRREITKIDLKSTYTMLNTDGELFLGGAENIVSTTGSRHFHGLSGCIKNLKLGSRSIHLIDNASSGHHVEQCL